MKKPTNKNAPDQGGAHFTKLAGGVKKQKKVFRCGVQHTSKFRIEMENAGLGLNDASAETQCQTLLRILAVCWRPWHQYFGRYCMWLHAHHDSRPGAASAGACDRFIRERVIGADGLVHERGGAICVATPGTQRR